jgi:hemoglobin-like flavoprotein
MVAKRSQHDAGPNEQVGSIGGERTNSNVLARHYDHVHHRNLQLMPRRRTSKAQRKSRAAWAAFLADLVRLKREFHQSPKPQ